MGLGAALVSGWVIVAAAAEPSDRLPLRIQGEPRVLVTRSLDDDRLPPRPGADRVQAGADVDRIGGDGGEADPDGRGKPGSVSPGDGATELSGGPEDDYLAGGSGNDVIIGDLGDDWLEGGSGADLIRGDGDTSLHTDPDGGDDILVGGAGNDDYDARGGMDIMVAGPGAHRYDGMLGFDWVVHAGSSAPAEYDMTLAVEGSLPGASLDDRFHLVEGLSGGESDDVMRGDGRSPTSPADLSMAGHELTTEDLDRIEGLDGVLGLRDTGSAPEGIVYSGGNILLGGPGSDLLEGRGGDDVLDGDSWLAVYLTGSMRFFDTLAEAEPLILDGSIGRHDLEVVRQVVTFNDPAGGLDTALFSGRRAEYDITPEGGARSLMTVVHARGSAVDGSDTLHNVEYLQFADEVLAVPGVGTNRKPAGGIMISDTSPQAGGILLATQRVTDSDGIPAARRITWTWESAPGTWTPFAEGPSAVLGDALVGFPVRAEVSFLDGRGKREVVVSGASAPVAGQAGAPMPVTSLVDRQRG